jgi:hypothetical protein
MTNETPAGGPARPANAPSPLRYLLPLLAVLAGIGVFVWISQPPPNIPQPAPTPSPKSAAELQKQIDFITKQQDIPPGQKSMILGGLKSELEQAKAREQGTTGAPKAAP